MLRSIDISTSGLVAQRLRMDAIAGNIAHSNTTRDANNKPSPYLRRFVSFTEERPESESQGSKVITRVEIDTNTPPRIVNDPTHPDADADGNVRFPNFDVTSQFVDLLQASRAYEANVAVVEMTREIANASMRILA